MKHESTHNMDDLFSVRFLSVGQDEFILSVDRAMVEFLRAIKRSTPEVLSSLAADVLPLYRSACTSGTAFEREQVLSDFPHQVIYGSSIMGRRPIASMPDELIAGGSGGAFLNLLHATYRWAKHFHLDGLILAYAARTLRVWSESGVMEPLDWEYRLEHSVKVDTRLGFELKYTQWLPDSDTWPSYEKKLNKVFSDAKREYKQRMQLISKSGKTLGKYKSEHFDWLVLFQIKEKDYEEIYEQYKETCNLELVRSISKAVKETAMLIALPLRNTGRKPGRPRRH